MSTIKEGKEKETATSKEEKDPAGCRPCLRELELQYGCTWDFDPNAANVTANATNITNGCDKCNREWFDYCSAVDDYKVAEFTCSVARMLIQRETKVKATNDLIEQYLENGTVDGAIIIGA